MSDEQVDYDVVFRTNHGLLSFCPSCAGSAGSWWQAASEWPLVGMVELRPDECQRCQALPRGKRKTVNRANSREYVNYAGAEDKSCRPPPAHWGVRRLTVSCLSKYVG